ncbi:MAG: SDR family NAD(P)-dependent oxidoreductase [Vallitalea sp.]|jgi:acyl transferase domain-containing protein/NAD(P)-dependent dehydrogenase (short-subunit alcohol dehydrogenase family)/acyl carrier protein|nr:SDR family NAD(P)-dependent oxidoreductase [Vallitalea sp.]
MEEILKGKLTSYLRQIISEETKLPVNKIKEKETFDKYGISSLAIINLNRTLEKDFKGLSKTLFFEYNTLEGLEGYFLENHIEELLTLFNIQELKETKEKEETVVNRLKDSISESDKLPKFRTFLNQKATNKDVVRREIGQEDIAIIGISGQYPMSNNLDELWKNLQEGRDCISDIPRSRWDNTLYYDEDMSKVGNTYLKQGGFIEDIDKFDPLFFNMSPNEAVIMDPSERLFLMQTWNALEDAGYSYDKISGKKVGVFVGVMWGQYQLLSGKIRDQILPGITSYASIANRISYYFDVNGPSMAVDTMCSSSLTSIHLACESIKRKESVMAIAGGVNLTIHPNKHIILCGRKFASSDARCRSFGEGGDGYVPGEGVGAIVLKSLHKAIEDGDQIHAIIKGTGVNHGGKTSGYSVPNPNAQGEVIADVMKKANIDPRTISYIEAHGTGTALGDPIEIKGLSNAFSKFTDDKGFCSIGSIKSNMGHLEGAAGIVGITKLLLQLKHKKLVPSLHSQAINKNLNFEETPFYVQHKLEEWKQPTIERNGVTKTYPRMGGVSSFGAGGSNAHIILQEYIKEPEPSIEKEYYLFVLSGKDSIQLKKYAKKMKNFFHEQSNNKLENNNLLQNTIYTLQLGRTVMEERLAIVCSNIEELNEKLEDYIEGIQSTNIYQSNINEGDGVTKYLKQNTKRIVDDLLNEEDYQGLAELWVLGVHVDFNKLYENSRLSYISLPTYPFKKESYWLGEIGNIGSDENPKLAGLTPLIDQNISTFKDQIFQKKLTGKELYLAHHVISGKRILPGAIYVEMARQAGVLSLQDIHIERIDNIRWLRPIIHEDKDVTVYTRLIPQDSYIQYEVFTYDKERRIIHADGELHPAIEPYAEEKMFIESIKDRCIVLDNQLEATDNSEFQYGSYYKCIEHIYGNEKEALAKLSLNITKDKESFVFHPAMLDATFRSVVGILGKEQGDVYLPYRIDQLHITKQIPSSCYVYAVDAEEDIDVEERKYNIYLLEADGSVIGKIEGFTVKKSIIKDTTKTTKNCYIKKEWVEDKEIQNNIKTYRQTDKVVVFSSNDKIEQAIIQSGLSKNSLIIIKKGNNYERQDINNYIINPSKYNDYIELIKSLEADNNIPTKVFFMGANEKLTCTRQGIEQVIYEDVYGLFFFVKGLIERKLRQPINIIFANHEENVQPVYRALGSFATVVKKENSKIHIKVVGINETSIDYQLLIQESFEDIYHEVRYEGDKRHLSKLTKINANSMSPIDIREEGVYLITGGLGGLGYIFATYLAKFKNTKLILLGRSPLDEHKKIKIEALRNLGAEVMYKIGDISNINDVKSLAYAIRERFGDINGIIHSAGILRDSFILKKTQEEFDQVLSPKVYGTLNLDEAFSKESLDFFVLCSSIASISANMGQSDYAYSNNFMDEFAILRNNMVQQGTREGKTLSINWPFWENGGMNISKEMVQQMKDSMGVVPLEDNSGIQAFEDALAMSEDSVVVFQAYEEKLYETMGIIQHTNNDYKQIEQIDSNPQVDILANIEEDDNIQIKVREMLIKILASELGINANQISSKELLDKYGIDSVSIMAMTDKLEATFGTLSKTLFFEYQTVEELANYFVTNYQEIVAKKYSNSNNLDKAVSEKVSSSLLSIDNKELHANKTFSLSNNKFVFEGNNKDEEKYAVIGLSGRYPQAYNIDSFWDNLAEGKDCITEIPNDRWQSYNKLYNVDKDKLNKLSKWGGFIDDVDKFDALFFNISPREAQIMDPQERLFLQSSWEVMEDAGYTRDGLSKYTVGVFVGAMWGQYQLLGVEETLKDNPIALDSNFAALANRVSYCLNLKGPSIALSTYCSSSLTAIHYACESIRSGECDLAIAGGVNLSIHPSKYLQLAQGNFTSSDGRCRSFGEGGDGYVPGEGVGAILIKPLEKAIKDKDNIYGVILGSGINHGGRTNGYSVPSPKAQGEMIEKVLEKTKVDPSTISYIEAHGTGTALGDPIEIAGLTKAFNKYSEDVQYCSIGSVKSNIGHAEAAAGIASVTKVLLQMKHEQLVPSIHSNTLNTNIDFEKTPFYVQQNITNWNPQIYNNKSVRRAGISSFGAGGSNAHIIMEDYQIPSYEPSYISKEQVIILSAKYEERLKEYANNLLIHVRKMIKPTDSLKEEILSMDSLKELLGNIISVDMSYIDPLEPIEDYGVDEVKCQQLLQEITDKYTSNHFERQHEHGMTLQHIYEWVNNHHAIEDEKENLYLEEYSVLLQQIAYTLQVGREEMEERLAIVACSIEDLCNKLLDYINGEEKTDIYVGNSRHNTLSGLFDQMECDALIEISYQKKNYQRLAKFFTEGLSIDWSKLHNEPINKISLPTYPFARERHWVHRNEEISKQTNYIINNQENKLQKTKLVKKWKVKSLLEEQNITGNVIVLINNQLRNLVNMFNTQPSVNAIVVSVDDKDKDVDYILDMKDNYQGRTLAKTIMDKISIDGIIDLSDVCSTQVDKDYEVYGKIGFYQQMIEAYSRQSFFLLHFTKELAGYQSINPTLAGALTAGFVKMLSSEYKKLNAKTIDIINYQQPRDILAIIRKEIGVSGLEGEVRYRKKQRFVPYITRESRDILESSWYNLIDSSKTVVITGGTSGIGKAIAKYLVEERQVNNLVLMGISPIPERELWEQYIKDSNISKYTRDKIEFLLSLESYGANVKVYTGSLTEKEKLRKFFHKIGSTCAPIGGVIHCAGVMVSNNPAFIKKTQEDMEKVFQPKIKGLHVLYDVLEKNALDYFINFSSISAMIPSLASGVSDYGAANCYMDTFAHFQKAQGNYYMKSLNWPNITSTGMGEVYSPIYRELGFTAQHMNDLLNLLNSVGVYSQETTEIPCIIDESKYDSNKILYTRNMINNHDKQAIIKPVEETLDNEAPIKPLYKKSNEQLDASSVISNLKKIFAEELRLAEDRLDETRNFSEFGVDSILIAELVVRIEAVYDIKLDPSILLDNPTLQTLGEYLAGEVTISANNILEEEIAITSKIEEVTDISNESNEIEDKIAIIGMACHFPQADNKDIFWKNLVEGKDCIVEIPENRWKKDKYYSATLQEGKTISKWGGFLKDIECFDPEYFGFPKEGAETFDPLIRQMLEVSAETFDDAGYTKKELSNEKIGVFIGTRTSDYSSRIESVSKHTLHGIAQNFVAAHVSHVFNLKGPSLIVDTACSSSITSIHLACQSIHEGDSDMALAGGVDILLDEKSYLTLSATQAMSPDGICHTFDEKANGFVPGEGCGAVLLKSLSKAIEDGDQIYGVIEASALNNDGKTMGVTTPNPIAQQEVIEAALTKGNINPHDISYIEAHGTGTLIGDPMELRALTKVFRKYTDDTVFCGIGSVKTNIGHLFSAAGVASFIKVVLSLHNKIMPATLHCDTPNSRFKFNTSPFYVADTTTEWTKRNDTRMAGISSFGFGGTNAHIILREFDENNMITYKPKRKALNNITYNKERYWLEKDADKVIESDNKEPDTLDKTSDVEIKVSRMFKIIEE